MIFFPSFLAFSARSSPADFSQHLVELLLVLEQTDLVLLLSVDQGRTL